MANARSRKGRGLTAGGVVAIGNSKKSSKQKSFELPFFVNFSEDSTPEERAAYWKTYNKQRVELSKHRKRSRQRKGIQRPYRMHRIIQNLTDTSYYYRTNQHTSSLREREGVRCK